MLKNIFCKIAITKTNLLTICFLIFSLSIASITYAQTTLEHNIFNKSSNMTHKIHKIKTKKLQSNINNDYSVLHKRLLQQQAINDNPFAIAFYKPNYVLPFYYTFSPYKNVYTGNTPNNQSISSQEFKAQFSFMVPLWSNVVGKDSAVNLGYTQQMYWQFYAKSQYFRETNYQPEIFISKKINDYLLTNLGIEHQSNGRGGDLERSWNRAYINFAFSQDNFALSLRPWILLFQGSSSDLHNKDIADYMGHGELLISYKTSHDINFSLSMRNNLESSFKHGTNELSVSFPLLKKVRAYVQIFSGYGQSLIEYNHYTNAIGFGIALSDWI